MPVNVFGTEKSVCLECEHKTRDKNHDDCVNCKARLGFVKIEPVSKPMPEPTLLHHIPETLPTKIKRRGRPPKPPEPKTAPETKFCPTCEKDKDIKRFPPDPRKPGGRRHECRACYQRRQSLNRGSRRKHGVLIDFEAIPEGTELLEAMYSLADREVRTIEQQVIYFCKIGMKGMDYAKNTD